jgi:hypothetical protein
MSGAAALRPIVAAAEPEHPSLVDATHRMDALFGVTNIPQVTWIDEDGMIVRPPEAGSPAPVPTDDPFAKIAFAIMAKGHPGPEWYSDRIRDWVANGRDSTWALRPSDVVEQSHPRSPDVSKAAAHFDLARHLWHEEQFSAAVLHHFAEAHTLQPDNITYKRQAYSAFSYGKRPEEYARFWQSPRPGEEDQWPFVSDFDTDMANLFGPDWLDGIDLT